MEHTGVRFHVGQWTQKVDKEGVLEVTIGDGGGEDECELILEWIPGTNPPEFQASCRDGSCPGSCELITNTNPDGSITFLCECMGGNRLAATSAKGKKKAAKPKAKVKKRKT